MTQVIVVTVEFVDELLKLLLFFQDLSKNLDHQAAFGLLAVTDLIYLGQR